MTLYRKHLLNCYCNILSTEFLLFKAAFHMHMHVEMNEMGQYLEDGYEFSRCIIEDSDDPVVKKINEFLADTDNYIVELEQRNQLSADDIMDSDADEEYEDEKDKEVKPGEPVAFTIFLLTVRIAERIKKALGVLCEIKNETPPADFETAWQYNDDNIQLIANFYARLCTMLHCLEKETRLIENKKNW